MPGTLQKTNLPAYAPAEKKPRFTLTDQDEEIFEAHFDYENLLTARQIARLFGISKWRAAERLKYLFHHEYLTRMDFRRRLLLPEMPTMPTRKAALCVAWRRQVELSELPIRTPRFSQIPHDMAVNDVHISVVLGIKNNPDFSLKWWKTAYWFSNQRKDPLLRTSYSVDGRTLSKRFEPDGAFCVAYKDKVYKRFFPEIDMNTQPQTRLAREKVQTFLSYVGSTGYKTRFGASFGQCLFVTVSPDRLRHLKRMIERTAGKRAQEFFVTTQDRVTEDTVFTAPIWQRCGTGENLVSLFREFTDPDSQVDDAAIVSPPTQQLLIAFG